MPDGDMNGRRGRISGMDTKGALQIVRAQAPIVRTFVEELKRAKKEHERR